MTQGNTIPGIGFLNGKQNMVFRIYRYAPDYPGLAGHDLTPQGPIELYPGGVAAARSDVAAGSSSLSQNKPNPFARHTAITYQLALGGPVQLRVYNLLGQEIRTLVNGNTAAGPHTVSWDGTDNSGRAVSQGIYVYRLVRGGASETRKMMLVR
jgi:hypothetical protein